MYSNVCSSCYVMKRQASLSLWISRPASRRRTEEEEVLDQSVVSLYRWKTGATYEPLGPICFKPRSNQYQRTKFACLASRSQSAPPIATPSAALGHLPCSRHFSKVITVKRKRLLRLSPTLLSERRLRRICVLTSRPLLSCTTTVVAMSFSQSSVSLMWTVSGMAMQTFRVTRFLQLTGPSVFLLRVGNKK